MGRPPKGRDRVAKTYSFSVPPELVPKMEYIHMVYGLSSWVQDILSRMTVDTELSTQYETIKAIIKKKNLYISHVGYDGSHYPNAPYTFAVRGLGRNKDKTIKLVVSTTKKIECNIRERYDTINRAIEEIKSVGLDAQWL